MKGTIAKLGNGFGYIKPTPIAQANASKTDPTFIHEEILFHVSALEGCEFKDLKSGDQVEFETDQKSPAIGATLVRRLKL